MEGTSRVAHRATTGMTGGMVETGVRRETPTEIVIAVADVVVRGAVVEVGRMTAEVGVGVIVLITDHVGVVPDLVLILGMDIVRAHAATIVTATPGTIRRPRRPMGRPSPW